MFHFRADRPLHRCSPISAIFPWPFVPTILQTITEPPPSFIFRSSLCRLIRGEVVLERCAGTITDSSLRIEYDTARSTPDVNCTLLSCIFSVLRNRRRLAAVPETTTPQRLHHQERAQQILIWSVSSTVDLSNPVWGLKLRLPWFSALTLGRGSVAT